MANEKSPSCAQPRLWPLENDHKERPIAGALMQADVDWASLRALAIERVHRLPGVSAGAAVDLVNFHSAVAWLLGNAKQLAFLCMNLYGLSCVPRLTQLKHLQVSLHGSVRQLAQSLGNLPNLQTLYLSQTSLVETLQRPSLELAGLNRLQSVSLSNVVPACFTIPLDAALHLRLYSLEDARQEVWGPLAWALHAVMIYAIGDTVRHLTELPNYIIGPVYIKNVMICVYQLGTCDLPIDLSGFFLLAERVILRCSGDMYIRVPARNLPWQLTKFVAKGTLQVVFDKVEEFFHSCPAFSIVYGSLRGLDVLSLVQYLTERGRQLVFVAHRDCFEIRSMCFPSLLCGPWVSCDRACLCGACPSCICDC